MKRSLAVSLAALAFVGAARAGEPEMPSSWPGFQSSALPADTRMVAKIEKMRWWQACVAWGREVRGAGNPRYRTALLWFLQSEGTLNGIDLMNVKAKDPQMGMSFCGVVAALGMPDRLNQTERPSGHSSQMVYRSRNLYVYTEGRDANGIVSSIQF